MYRLAAAGVVALLLELPCLAACPRTQIHINVPASPNAAMVRIANSRLDLGSGVRIFIRSLEGSLVPLRKGPPRVTELHSILVIDRAEVSFEAGDSAALMNNFVLKDSSVKNIQIRADGAELEQSATLRGTHLPVTFCGTLQQEGDLIHLHPTSFTGDWLGIELEKHIGAKPKYGMCVEKNEIFLDPSRMLQKLLLVKGQLTGAFVRDGQIVETFGRPTTMTGAFVEFQEPGRAAVRIDTNGATPTLASLQQDWNARRPGGVK